jgi:mannose-6-phosphate isomerase-like protein (cupin superfamily)
MMAVRNISFQSAELDDVIAQAQSAPDGYAGEVLRSDLLSVGLYILAAGGRSKLRVGAEDHPVKPGSLLFVPAHAVHFFHDIAEELILVVFWAPPEGSGEADRPA